MAISVSDADRLYLGFAFSVAIRQRVVAGFSEVSGLVIETEVETFREGGVNDCERQLAGPTKFPTRLVLKRGMGDLRHLWDWYLGVTQGRIERRDVTIVINDRVGVFIVDERLQLLPRGDLHLRSAQAFTITSGVLESLVGR